MNQDEHPADTVGSGTSEEDVAEPSIVLPIKPTAADTAPSRKGIPHLPVVFGGIFFVLVLGGVIYTQNKERHVEQVPHVPTPILVNGQSLAEFRVEYGKSTVYAAYVPEQKVSYSARTNAPAKSVAWLVCDTSGQYRHTIALVMQQHTDPVLKSRLWSTSAAALPPKSYHVTVRAESEAGEIALQSFLFDPIHGVDTTTPTPECKTAKAGI